MEEEMPDYLKELLEYLKEIVSPLKENSSLSESEVKILANGYQVLMDEKREPLDRIRKSTELFQTTDIYLQSLIDRIESIVQPLTTDITIENEDKEVYRLILSGYAILLDESIISKKKRLQLACDSFDEAQYMPYNPYHSRVALARAIGTWEFAFGAVQFERTPKTEIIN